MKTGKVTKRQKSSTISVDRSQWSESSQRTYTSISVYTDIAWRCRGCGQSFVFTAQEQKQAYEHEGVYIHWRPVLCDACASQAQSARDDLYRYEKRWKEDKQALQHDLSFLKRWLTALETHGRLTGHRSQTVITMLERLIREQG